MASFKENTVIYILLIYVLFHCAYELFLFTPILYLTVYPFNRKLCKKLINYLILPAHYYYLYIIQYLQNVNIKCYMDAETKKMIGKESAFIITNHHSELDWFIMYAFANHYNIIQILKVVLVSRAKKIPIFGPVMAILDFAFVNRSFKDDQKYLLDKAKEWGEIDGPCLSLMFPEGTRLTKEKHEASNKFAVEKGMSPMKYHLFPRTKGFVTILEALKHKFNAIYDCELAYVGTKPTFANILDKKPLNVHLYLRRIPVESVPLDKEDYLYKVFREKDEFADSFNKKGHFLDVAGINEEDVFEIKPPKHTNAVLFVLFSLQTFGIIYCLYKLYINQYYIALSLILLFFGVSYKMIVSLLKNITMKARTSYGETNNK